jgi:hypothetical protein
MYFCFELGKLLLETFELMNRSNTTGKVNRGLAYNTLYIGSLNGFGREIFYFKTSKGPEDPKENVPNVCPVSWIYRMLGIGVFPLYPWNGMQTCCRHGIIGISGVYSRRNARLRSVNVYVPGIT